MSAYENRKLDNEILLNLKKMKDIADAEFALAASIKTGKSSATPALVASVKEGEPSTKTIVRSLSASNPDTTPISDNVQIKSLPRTETTGNYKDIH